MRIVYVVPGGVDPPDRPQPRVIPFVHHLVRSMAERHDVAVVAVGHDPEPGEWTLFGAPVVNVPVGAHAKTDTARVLAEAPKVVRRFGKPDVVHGLWANLPGLAAVTAAGATRAASVVSVCGGELAAVPSIGYGGGLQRGTRQLATASLRMADEVTVATEGMPSHVAAAGGRTGRTAGSERYPCTRRAAAGFPSPPARPSCRRSATPSPPSWCAPRSAG